jgi:hypothetical protein
LFKRCKKSLSELALSAKIDRVPMHITELSCLKHLSIQSELVDLIHDHQMEFFAKMFPLQGLQSLRIRFGMGDIHFDVASVRATIFYFQLNQFYL